MKSKENNPNRKAKFKVGDMVYSWQNPNYKARVSFVRDNGVEDNTDYGFSYKVTLKDREGYTHSSKWMDEDSLYKYKKKKDNPGHKNNPKTLRELLRKPEKTELKYKKGKYQSEDYTISDILDMKIGHDIKVFQNKKWTTRKLKDYEYIDRGKYHSRFILNFEDGSHFEFSEIEAQENEFIETGKVEEVGHIEETEPLYLKLLEDNPKHNSNPMPIKVLKKQKFYHARFIEPIKGSEYKTPDWAEKVADSVYDGSEVTMMKREGEKWELQKVMVPVSVGNNSAARAVAKKIYDKINRTTNNESANYESKKDNPGNNNPTDKDVILKGLLFVTVNEDQPCREKAYKLYDKIKKGKHIVINDKGECIFQEELSTEGIFDNEVFRQERIDLWENKGWKQFERQKYYEALPKNIQEGIDKYIQEGRKFKKDNPGDIGWHSHPGYAHDKELIKDALEIRYSELESYKFGISGKDEDNGVKYIQKRIPALVEMISTDKHVMINDKGICQYQNTSDDPGQCPSDNPSLEQTIMFINNVKQDFIEQAWKGNPHIINHLNDKLSGYVKQSEEGYRSGAVMIRFLTELDSDNRKILGNYIVKTHPGYSSKNSDNPGNMKQISPKQKYTYKTTNEPVKFVENRKNEYIFELPNGELMYLKEGDIQKDIIEQVKLSENILNDLREQRGLDANDKSEDDKILSQSRKKILKDYMQWNGIKGYDSKIIEITGIERGNPSHKKKNNPDSKEIYGFKIDEEVLAYVHKSDRWHKAKIKSFKEEDTFIWVNVSILDKPNKPEAKVALVNLRKAKDVNIKGKVKIFYIEDPGTTETGPMEPTKGFIKEYDSLNKAREDLKNLVEDNKINEYGLPYGYIAEKS